ncbi:MAG TPA: hypothetical protein PK299_14040 [Anaerolineales bacterium]|nr:hypothetical protein [Anaerolineales bacterium]
MEKTLSYINKKGNRVEITVTHHALERFFERWNRIFPHLAITRAQLWDKLAEQFAMSNRVGKINSKLRLRQKRHGKDTLYFRGNGLTFVVQDATLLTVEIHTEGKRYLNKPSLF